MIKRASSSLPLWILVSWYLLQSMMSAQAFSTTTTTLPMSPRIVPTMPSTSTPKQFTCLERYPTQLFASSSSPPPILEITNDPFATLGLPSDTWDKKLIKKGYKQMALKFHPDAVCHVNSPEKERKTANDQFARINAAYAYLTSDKAREDAEKKRKRQAKRESQNQWWDSGGFGNQSTTRSTTTRSRTQSSRPPQPNAGGGTGFNRRPASASDRQRHHRAGRVDGPSHSSSHEPPLDNVDPQKDWYEKTHNQKRWSSKGGADPFSNFESDRQSSTSRTARPNQASKNVSSPKSSSPSWSSFSSNKSRTSRDEPVKAKPPPTHFSPNSNSASFRDNYNKQRAANGQTKQQSSSSSNKSREEPVKAKSPPTHFTPKPTSDTFRANYNKQRTANGQTKQRRASSSTNKSREEPFKAKPPPTHFKPNPTTDAFRANYNKQRTANGQTKGRVRNTHGTQKKGATTPSKQYQTQRAAPVSNQKNGASSSSVGTKRPAAQGKKESTKSAALWDVSVPKYKSTSSRSNDARKKKPPALWDASVPKYESIPKQSQVKQTWRGSTSTSVPDSQTEHIASDKKQSKGTTAVPFSPQINPKDTRVVRVLRSRTARKERKRGVVEELATKKARASSTKSDENLTSTPIQKVDRKNPDNKRLSDLLNKNNARKFKDKIKRNVPDSLKNHQTSNIPKQPTDLKTVMQQYNSSFRGGPRTSVKKESIPSVANNRKRNHLEKPKPVSKKGLSNKAPIRQKVRTDLNSGMQQYHSSIPNNRKRNHSEKPKPVSEKDLSNKPPIRQKVRTDLNTGTQQFHSSNLNSSRIGKESRQTQESPKPTNNRQVVGHQSTFSHSAMSEGGKPESFSTNPNDYVSKYTNVARRTPSTKRNSHDDKSFAKNFNTVRTHHPPDSFPEASRWKKFRVLNRIRRNSRSAAPESATESMGNEGNVPRRKSFSTNFQYDNASTTKASKSKRKRLKAFLSRVFRRK